MKKELTIEVPKNYSAVSLKKYLEFRDAIEAYKDEPEAVDAFAFNLLCDVPVNYIYQIDSDTISKMRADLASFLNNTDYELQKFIKIGEVEYGFEPNLSQMTYGAYLDCIKYDTITIDKNWSKIMNILYRPVKKKVGTSYEIEPYSPTFDDAKFLDVKMDVHFGALFFLLDLLRTLSHSILKSMKGQTEIFHQLNTILEKNGNRIPQSTNWQKEILQNSIRL
jgi:hypothetical protein